MDESQDPGLPFCNSPDLDDFSESEDDSNYLICLQQLFEPDEFDSDFFQALRLKFLLEEDNLPPTTGDFSELQQLLNHARPSEDPLLPEVSRETVGDELTSTYNLEKKRLKDQLDKLKGRVAITLDLWKSDNSLDILGVQLQSHDENLRLQNHVIGFEVLNLEASYSGEELYGVFKNVLKDYGITKRLISITSNNTPPVNSLVKRYSNEIMGDHTPFGFDGDIRCVGHVLNSIAGVVLNYTFFEPNKPNETRDKITEIEEVYPDHVRAVKNTAEIVFCLIDGVRDTAALRNAFAGINAKSSEKEKGSSPQTHVRDNEARWLSTFRTLQRFLYFREEFLLLLDLVKVQPKSSQKDYDLKSLSMSEFDWDYIATVEHILSIIDFRMMRLHDNNCQTAGLTMPHMAQLLMNFEKINTPEFKKSQPLLALGLLDACAEILKYYDIRGNTIEPLKHLYLATVLDPRLKLKTFKNLCFSKTIIDAVEKYFYEIFHIYKREHNKNKRAPSHTNKKRKVDYHIQNVSKYDKDIFTVEDLSADDSEIRVYLSEMQLGPECDIGQYYRQRRGVLPILFEMAKDYLCIPAMSEPVESLFPQVKCMVADKGHNAVPGLIKMVAILKSRGLFVEPTCDFIDHDDDDDDDDGSVVETIHQASSDE
ncbi:hypothetical protein HF325_000500 [Metschnikowia pulcherrima]|uniref:HAT C-terminal dimerisation domain-containing protein n=1 Tax=Metschnikowia pulcherrima TaxID=27326 RepID=A0A8H7GX41_9ASCO|nr:hypothetical protein HF325_000500 [Metschnikowia pulcherrima]